MRVFIGIFGAFVGLLIGFASAIFLAFKVAGGDDFGGAMLCVLTIPVGLLAGAVFGVVLALRTQHYLQRADLGRTARRKKTVLVLGLVLGIPALVVGMFRAVDHHDDPPSDQQMLANFHQHQTTFNQLVQMAQTDKGLTGVGDDWTSPDVPLSVGITQSRIDQYRKLFGVAGTPGGFGSDAESVEFYYWGHGSAISSDTDKGYIYAKKAPTPLLPSLDGCHPSGESATFAYRHIEGNWYLYYKYLPG